MKIAGKHITNEELNILSDGLTELINNELEALKLTKSKHAQRNIRIIIDRYRKLNDKILDIVNTQAKRVRNEIEILDNLSREELFEYIKNRRDERFMQLEDI